MSRIHQLSTGVINKIAAGEVIERPASVVKELLENSIDALATRIEVDVVNGGADLIRIVDNGEGIHPDDLMLSVSSHATSKLTSADDLFRVQTMGFRGEALASISEVSRFTIRSRTPDSETGMQMEIHAGDASPPQVCGCPLGTQIEIRDLFLSTPVRRKFLKRPGTEFSHISEQFTRIALANPRLQMVLRHNEKTVHDLPPTDHLHERLQHFYGKKLSEQLIRVDGEQHGSRLWGYVAHPSVSKASRKQQYFFLNGRWIQDRSLQHALTQAYRGLLMVGRQPIAFLFLEVPADQVDVNVHPTKSEVRFRESQQLYRLLLSTLRSKFLSMDLESELSLNRASSENSGAGGLKLQPTEMQKELTEWAKLELQKRVEEANLRPQNPTSPFDPTTTTQNQADTKPATPWLPPPPSSFYNQPTVAPSTQESPNPYNPDSHSTDSHNTEEIHSTNTDAPSVNSPETAQTSSTASNVPADLGDFQTYQPNTAIQVNDCYVVIATEDGLTVIDQHALHERILYEYFRERVLNGAVESQRLLVPETLELSPREAALLLDHAELIGELGFGVENFGQNTVAINRFPTLLKKSLIIDIIREMIDRLDEAGDKIDRRDLLDTLLHMMSCKAAIKAGQRLTQDEMESLLAQRHLVDDAHHCPHGRPTALKLSRNELDRQFGRLG